MRRGMLGRMRFWQNSSAVDEVIWFRVPEGTPVITQPIAFRSRLYGAGPRGTHDGMKNSGVGLQEPYKIDQCNEPVWMPYYSGQAPPLYLGINKCGTDQVWSQGGVSGVDPAFQCDAGGRAPCCAKPCNPKQQPILRDLFLGFPRVATSHTIYDVNTPNTSWTTPPSPPAIGLPLPEKIQNVPWLTGFGHMTAFDPLLSPLNLYKVVIDVGVVLRPYSICDPGVSDFELVWDFQRDGGVYIGLHFHFRMLDTKNYWSLSWFPEDNRWRFYVAKNGARSLIGSVAAKSAVGLVVIRCVGNSISCFPPNAAAIHTVDPTYSSNTQIGLSLGSESQDLSIRFGSVTVYPVK